MFETHLGHLIPSKRSVLPWVIAGLLLSFAGCADMHTTTATNPTSAQQSTVQFKMGDAPADRVLSFEVTVGPVTLTADTGATVTILSDTRRIELSHLSATNTPLQIVKLPQGNYTAATLAIANPEITFLDASGQMHKIEPVFNQAITVPFNPPLVIGGPSAVVSVDFDLSKSLTFDAQGNVTGVNISSASFSVSTAPVANGGNQNDNDGELEDTTGTITAVNGSSFTLLVNETGASLQFTTDANTQFEDGASLTVNEIVTVEGSTNPDGTLYARRIEGVENEAGGEAEGLITTVTGSPATSVTLVTDQTSGNGGANAIGGPITADVPQAKFVVNDGDVDTSGMDKQPTSSNFPFDASTIHAGQSVEIDSDGGGDGGGGGDDNSMNNPGFVAKKVRLQQQSLVGTVSGLMSPTSQGPTTFTLTVAADSAFAMLSGQTQVTVYWQSNTNLQNLANVSNGDTIRVRGLVFFTGSNFNMIARRITN